MAHRREASLYGSGPPSGLQPEFIGQVYIDLDARTTYVFWGSQAGEFGIQGAQGPAGPQGGVGVGVQGPVGDTGSQGPIGDAGSQGPAGEAGAQGDVGDTGSQGSVGDTGAQGSVGDTGAQGPEGIGIQGPAGESGVQGPIGETGNQGPQGDLGSGELPSAYIQEPGQQSLTSGTWVDIPNLSTTVTLGTQGHIQAWFSGVATSSGAAGGTEAEFRLSVAGETSNPILHEPYDDIEHSVVGIYRTSTQKTAGTYTIKVQWRRVVGTATIYFEDANVGGIGLVCGGEPGPRGPQGAFGGPQGPQGIQGPAAVAGATQITATATDSTTSGTYSVINGMTTTPAAGTYLVMFSSSGEIDSGGDTGQYAIHVDGTIVQHSERDMESPTGFIAGDIRAAMHTQAVVEVDGDEAIDVRFRQSGGTFSVFGRSLILMEVQ